MSEAHHYNIMVRPKRLYWLGVLSMLFICCFVLCADATGQKFRFAVNETFDTLKSNVSYEGIVISILPQSRKLRVINSTFNDSECLPL